MVCVMRRKRDAGSRRRTALAAVCARSPSLLERLAVPSLVTMEDAQKMRVVRLPGFLSEREQQQLHDLAVVVRQSEGHHHGLAEGNWRTTFLNQALVQQLPELWALMRAAMGDADARYWEILDEERRKMLSLRSAEYHVVLPTGGLPTPSSALGERTRFAEFPST